MHKLMIDLETRSDADITKTGVYRYADSPYFDILLFAYSVDDAPVKVIDLASGESLPDDILLLFEFQDRADSCQRQRQSKVSGRCHRAVPRIRTKIIAD